MRGIHAGIVCATLVAACGGEVQDAASTGATGGAGGGGGAQACPPPPCEIGTCEAETLATAGYEEGHLVGPTVTGHFLYWGMGTPDLTHSWLYRVPRCGGGAELVEEAEGSLRALAAHEGELFAAYWGHPDMIDERPHMKRYSDDGDVITLPEEINAWAGTDPIDASSGGLFWIGQNGSSEFGAFAYDMGSPSQVRKFVDADAWSGISTDDEDLFWGGFGGVRRAKLTAEDGKFDVVLPLNTTAGLALSGEWIAAYDVEASDNLQEILVSKKDGSGAKSIIKDKLFPPLVGNGQHVYGRTILNGNGVLIDADVFRFTPPSTELEVVFTDKMHGEIDVADGWLYTITGADEVVRVPLPN